MNVGEVVWIDGSTPALVVGEGTDDRNITDGRLFVVKLGDVEVIEPNEEGAYNFGSTPYDTDAGKDRHAQSVNPGGFGAASPAAPDNAPAPGTTLDGGTPTPTGGYDPAGTDAVPSAYDRTQDDRLAADEAAYQRGRDDAAREADAQRGRDDAAREADAQRGRDDAAREADAQRAGDTTVPDGSTTTGS